MNNNPFGPGLDNTGTIVKHSEIGGNDLRMTRWESEFGDPNKHKVIYTPGQKFDEGDIVLYFELENGSLIPVGARGEIVKVTGREKTRKTLLAQAMLMSNYINDINVTLGFKMKITDEPIIVVDTEQPRRRVRKNNHRFHRIVGVENHLSNYHLISAKHLTSGRMIDFITYHIMKIQDKTGVNPGALVTDQIVDLIPTRDENDKPGVNKVMDALNGWHELMDNNAIIIPIIHTNRGGKDSNGSMGSLLDKKVDGGFLVDLDIESMNSTVFHQHARDERIPKFEFRQDPDGTPRLLHVEEAFNGHI